MTSTYVIRGGLEGRERLRVLARVMWPTTQALLARIGIPADARCLDVGCGGGDVTVALARLVPDGLVIGVDVDRVKIDLARREAADADIANVEFRVHDVLDAEAHDRADADADDRAERFDLVYVRFVLTHLPDPAAALANLATSIAPGGTIVVEDCDFSGHFCHPEATAFRRYVDLYTAVVQSRGCDPNIGPRLPSLLRDAGFVEVAASAVQPAGVSGEVKLIAPITMEAIAEAVLAAQLCTPAELHAIVDDLYAFANDEDAFVSATRVVQAWARAPS